MERRAMAAMLRQASPFFLIAGPCVIESEQIVQTIATRLTELQETLGIPVIFKASFDKANRQSLTSYRGPGLQDGLAILQRVRERTGLPVLTDVHETHQVLPVARVVDVLQIPALLSRQTDLLVAAAQSGRLVNVKKATTMSAETMVLAADKVIQTQGDRDVVLTERGSMFGYSDLVVDARNLVKMRRAGGLVVQDITHSVQHPTGGSATTSGGEPEYIATVARMAAAVGVDGFFLETHPDPASALCDGSSMLPLDQLPELVEELVEIAKTSRALEAKQRR